MNVILSDGTPAIIPDGLSDDAITNQIHRLEAANNNAKAAAAPPSQGASSSAATAEPGFWSKVVAWGNQTPQEAFGFGKPTGTPPAVTGAAPKWGFPGLSSDPTAGFGAPDPIFTRERLPSVYAALDWLKSTSPGNFVGNVGADIAALPWDAPASISNAILHTAQNYGFAPNEPSAEMAAPRIKAALGVTPLANPWAQRAETAAETAATSGGGLVQRVVNAVLGEAKGEAGSYAGGKIADVTDPRLHEGLSTAGAVTAQAAPFDRAAAVTVAPVAKKLFGAPEPGPNAPPDAPPGPAATYKAAQEVQNFTGSPTTPITAGQLSAPFLQTVERWLSGLPLVGSPIKSAQANVEEQIRQTRDKAAQAVAGPNATVDTSPSAPGIALLNGVRDHVNNAVNAAKPQIDAIENQLGTQNVRGPGGGSAMVDVRGLVNALNGLKSATDAAGNVRATVAPEIAAKIDAEIANINRARQPENPALDAFMQSNINRAQSLLNDPQTPPQNIPSLQAQLQHYQALKDANLRVPFEALRQMKTLQGADTFGDGTPTLNGYMDGKVYAVYGKALQGFADSLDPKLGADYSKATSDYQNAMNLQRTFKKIVQGANENQLTSTMTSGLKGPENIRALAGTPAWSQAAANTIAMLGRTPSGAFDVNQFVKQWGGATDAAKAFYTQGSPAMRDALDAAVLLGRSYKGGPEKPLTASGYALTSGLEHLLGLGGPAAKYGVPAALGLGTMGLESAPMTRALAGQSPLETWGQSALRNLRQNLPALLAVAQQQGRSQGY
jgi:hypothetical protein